MVAARVAQAQQPYRYPFQNPALPIEERVKQHPFLDDAEEKVANLGTDPRVPRLGIIGSGHVEGLHGLRWVDLVHGAGSATPKEIAEHTYSDHNISARSRLGGNLGPDVVQAGSGGRGV